MVTIIQNKDRSYWLGASDTQYVTGNWNTKTFENFFLQKLGINNSSFSNIYTITGTYQEGKILDFISPFIEKDKQILIPELRLRINLDGNVGKHIYEVKTHSAEKPFKVSKAYWQQIQVQMYGYGTKEAEIVSYGLTEADYKNYFLPIDPDRLKFHPIEYDAKWINEVFLPKLRYLAKCLEEGRFPQCT